MKAIAVLVLACIAHVALAGTADSNHDKNGCLQYTDSKGAHPYTNYGFSYEQSQYTLYINEQLQTGDVNISPFLGNTNLRVEGWPQSDPLRVFQLVPAQAKLPSGLFFDNIGNIMGTPLRLQSFQTYTVAQVLTGKCSYVDATGKNNGGVWKTTVQLSVHNRPPYPFTYPQTQYLFDACYFIERVVPSVGELWSESRQTTYSVDPDLPDGLKLNSITGVIYGMPTQWAAEADYVNYVVTAANDAGSTTTPVSIRVKLENQAPRSIYYWHFPIINLTRGRVLPTFYPKHCGIIDEYRVNPLLPAGLDWDSSRGSVGGRPQHTLYRTKFVVKAVNQWGSSVTYIRMRIWDGPFYVLKHMGWKAEASPPANQLQQNPNW